MNTHVDLSPSWQVKVWENKRHGAEKEHDAGKKVMALEEKGMALGKGHGTGEKGHGTAPC